MFIICSVCFQKIKFEHLQLSTTFKEITAYIFQLKSLERSNMILRDRRVKEQQYQWQLERQKKHVYY